MRLPAWISDEYGSLTPSAEPIRDFEWPAYAAIEWLNASQGIRDPASSIKGLTSSHNGTLRTEVATAPSFVARKPDNRLLQSQPEEDTWPT
jgi:hypothetical protein